MKFFDCDWNQIFRWLPVWDQLSSPARRQYLLAVSHAQSILEEHYGDELPFLLSSGLVQRAGPNRAKPAANCIEFRRIMRQLGLFPLFDENGLKKVFEDYKRKHFFTEELNSVHVAGQWVGSDDRAWLDHFLNSQSVVEWEMPLRSSHEPSRYRGWRFTSISDVKAQTYVANEEIGAAAQCLVRSAFESPEPLPMLKLSDLVPKNLQQHVAAAFKAAVRYRLVYPALCSNNLNPVFWIHPEFGRYIHRPRAERARPVQVSELAAPAILPDDMAVVLVEAAGRECRVKRDGWGIELFAKIQAQLVSELPTLPESLERHFKPEERLHQALRRLDELKFMRIREITGPARILEPTNSGLAWLRQSPDDRIRDLILELHRRRKASAIYGNDFKFFPGTPSFFTKENQGLDLTGLMQRIWGEATGEGALPLIQFITFHSRESHPLVDSQGKAVGVRAQAEYGLRPLSEAKVEELWGTILKDFFWKRLVVLGAVDTGLDSEQRLCFRLNSTGAFLLGLANQIKTAAGPQPAGVIVQPNFEIVFLQPNAAAEVDISAFAERLRKGVGTLFIVTRRSILRAAAKGFTTKQVLEILGHHGAKQVPANVAAEIHAWFGACRLLPVRQSWLIENPDRETAVRVQKVLGAQCSVVGETLLEVRAAAIEPALGKALAEIGLFLRLPQDAQRTEMPEDEESL